VAARRCATIPVTHRSMRGESAPARPRGRLPVGTQHATGDEPRVAVTPATPPVQAGEHERVRAVRDHGVRSRACCVSGHLSAAVRAGEMVSSCAGGSGRHFAPNRSSSPRSEAGRRSPSRMTCGPHRTDGPSVMLASAPKSRRSWSTPSPGRTRPRSNFRSRPSPSPSHSPSKATGPRACLPDLGCPLDESGPQDTDRRAFG
jgi:hypothetical protein